MNEKKKKIFITICIAIIVICIVVIAFMNQKTEVLDKKSKMLDDALTETESGQTVETEYTRLEGEDFFFKVPTSFKSLDNQTISQKYTSNIPDMVFANKDGTINFIISKSKKNISDDKIKELKDVMVNKLKKKYKILDTNTHKVDGYTVGQIKMISNEESNRTYNNLAFFAYNEKLVIINFNCTKDLMKEWKGVGDFLIESLFFKTE